MKIFKFSLFINSKIRIFWSN